mmetsp:Transcript_12636/g.26543  ORF Transcript_12636/g.26543 Transcript_12636/m.26543 type:complete len:228 (-) Transcript_12636:86-769(-)
MPVWSPARLRLVLVCLHRRVDQLPVHMLGACRCNAPACTPLHAASRHCSYQSTPPSAAAAARRWLFHERSPLRRSVCSRAALLFLLWKCLFSSADSRSGRSAVGLNANTAWSNGFAKRCACRPPCSKRLNADRVTFPVSVSTHSTSPCLSLIFSALTCPLSTDASTPRNVVLSAALFRLDVRSESWRLCVARSRIRYTSSSRESGTSVPVTDTGRESMLASSPSSSS